MKFVFSLVLPVVFSEYFTFSSSSFIFFVSFGNIKGDVVGGLWAGVGIKDKILCAAQRIGFTSEVLSRKS